MLGVARGPGLQLCRAASASTRFQSAIDGSTAAVRDAIPWRSAFACSSRGVLPLHLSRGAQTEAEGSKKGGEAQKQATSGPSESLTVKVPLKDVKPADSGKFVVFTEEDAKELLPEGCPSFTREFEDSASRRLLLRDVFFRLRRHLIGDAPAAAADAKIASPSTVLMGVPGSGKSTLVAMTVAWARANGWLALYVPQAHLLTERSQFSRNEATKMLDTPEHAHQILHSLEAAHGALLKALPRQMDGAGPSDTLASLVAKGTAPGASHSVAVDAALDMIEELRRCTKVPVLIAVDALNALSGWSEYHQVLGPKSRKRLDAGQLRVAAAVRDSTKRLARGAFLGAVTSTGGLSPRLELLAVEEGAKRTVDGFSQQEVETMLAHYALGGLVQAGSPEEIAEMATQMRVLVSGSGETLRQNVSLPTMGGLVSRVGRRTII